MTRHKLSISECTTYGASFEEDVKAYAQAGADGIGIWEFKLPHGRDEDLRAALRDSPLTASLCIGTVPSPLPDPFFSDPTDPKDRVAAMIAGVQRLARFEPEGCIVVLTGEPVSGVRDGGWSVAVDGLKEVAKAAADVGVRLGLEPLRQTSGTLIPSLEYTARMLEDIGDDRVGITFDTWHFWDYPHIADSIARYAHRIAGVQVNDWRRETRSWLDRVLPGDGVMDYAPILGALDAAGYGGWYDVEVFSDDGRFGNDFADSIWKRDTSDVAKDTMSRRAVLWPDESGGS